MRPVILVLNGPGLAQTGGDHAADGGIALEGVRDACAALAGELGVEIDFRSTEDLDEMLLWLEGDSVSCDALIVNPFGNAVAANVDLPRYRAAMRVAAQRDMPLIEVHADNLFTRRAGVVQPVHEGGGDAGLVCGLGEHGYLLAIEAAAARLRADGAGQ